MVIEPPQNGGYLIAAYVVTTVILLGYWVRLWFKARRVFPEATSSRPQRGT